MLGIGFGLAVTIGNTIGAGIFRAPGEVATHLPDPRLFLAAWIVGGLYALLGAIQIAELGTTLPRSGGLYTFSRHALGEYAGFVVVSTYTFLIRQGEINIEAFIQQHQPEAIVYDIAPPYTSNWHLFEHISQLPGLKGRPFVLTSTNPARVRELAKTDEAIFEIVETPYQIMQLVDIVRKATRHLPAERSE